MKRILYFLLATVSGVVLLFSYRTSLDPVMPAESPTATPSAAAPNTSGDAATPTPTPSAGNGTDGGTSTGTGLADGTWTGSAANTRYGPVQVEVTVAGGEITAVDVLEYPNADRHDQMINSRALPMLVSETLDAQSADVSMISGATYTSDGYRQSLQSALDQAQQ
ncbi:FMN-binding protein [Microbacterium sp.]|uniref:FMN-binding protein n=1 Tax=Microbacterium sp. TaxID=51671 RepID=UPI003A8BFA18